MIFNFKTSLKQSNKYKGIISKFSNMQYFQKTYPHAPFLRKALVDGHQNKRARASTKKKEDMGSGKQRTQH